MFNICLGLMKIKGEFLSLGKYELGDGSQVRFWEDAWIRPRPLKLLFPTLYNIVRKKMCFSENGVVYNTVKCNF
jgi:hypothetical protein